MQEEFPPLDVLVSADTKDVFDEASKVVSSVPNLRPLYAGPLADAHVVESLTALVLNLRKLNGGGEYATKFVSR
jgi:predicted dinucleotide-binding enzyme